MNNRKYVDPFSEKTKSNRHRRDIAFKKKLSDKASSCIGFPYSYSLTNIEYEFINGVTVKKRTKRSYIKRVYRGNASRYIKIKNNRLFRRSKDEYFGKSNIHKKTNEFWRALY